jgi:serine/threonine-protein kinase
MQSFDAMSQLEPPRSGWREPGMTIDGRYRIEALLGYGTLGVVFRAHDTIVDRTVALKVLSGIAGASGTLARFERETQALAEIRHENVAQIYGAGSWEGFHYIAMELVAGRTLSAIISDHAARGTTIAWDDAIAIVRRIAAGLAAVHERQLAHRNVKPSNIVLEERTGRPVLVDFLVAHDDGGSRPLTTRSDVYSLACTASELLVGRRELEPVFRRAMAEQPAERYATCDELVAALDDTVGSMPSGPRTRRAAPLVRVLVVQRDGEARRAMLEALSNALRASGDAVDLECVESHRAFLEAFARHGADIVVIDDDDVCGAAGGLVDQLRASALGSLTEVVVLSTLSSRRLAALGVREVPKPINMQVFRCVAAKAGIRLAEKRFATKGRQS